MQAEGATTLPFYFPPPLTCQNMLTTGTHKMTIGRRPLLLCYLTGYTTSAKYWFIVFHTSALVGLVTTLMQAVGLT